MDMNTYADGVRPTSKCKCGAPAEFIKDYFVTETKKVKEKTYDEVFVSNEEYVCGIIRRRFCGKCLSRIASYVKKRDRSSNAVIVLSAFIPFFLAALKFGVDFFLSSEKTALIPFALMSAATVIVTGALIVRFSREQGRRGRIERGIYTDLKSIELLLDSLNYGITDHKKLKDIPSLDVVSDGDGRINYDMERSGFSLRTVIEGKINIEPMTERMKYPFGERSDYVRKTYVNAGLLEDNMKTESVKAQSKNDITVKNGIVVRYSGLSEEIRVPDGTLGIGARAFMKSKNCESVMLPESVSSIGKEAFSSCPAKRINIPSGVKTVSAFAFYGSGITEAVLPEGTEILEDSAFAYCNSLERVTLPSTCKKLGSNAFRGCIALKELVISEGTESIGDYAFAECTSLEAVFIPDGVFEVGNFAFEGCSALKTVRLPDSIQFMGGRAFDGSPNAAFTGDEGSYAEKYAEKERRKFVLTARKYSAEKKKR